MSVPFKPLFLAALLAAAPAFAMAQSDDAPEEAVTETSVEAADDGDADAGEVDASAGETPEADDEEAEVETETEELSEADAWAAKLRKRHHEGDVALGVCGGRMTALMWFYQSSVADGREDLKPAYDAIKESRTVLKMEAERRAIDDGIATSVSVMNEHSAELWENLIEASAKPEEFQGVHDELFAGVKECLSMFFNRGVTKADAEPAKSEEETDADAESADGKAD